MDTSPRRITTEETEEVAPLVQAYRFLNVLKAHPGSIGSLVYRKPGELVWERLYRYNDGTDHVHPREGYECMTLFGDARNSSWLATSRGSVLREIPMWISNPGLNRAVNLNAPE